ncbi:hypothetical protein HDV00_008193 [Rhizophlyctis rosea]|nr:hypothetical protein HDV00_008193 [Rhizophlyctis rosea]
MSPNPPHFARKHYVVAVDTTDAAHQTLEWTYMTLCSQNDVITVITILGQNERSDEALEDAQTHAQNLLNAIENTHQKRVEAYYRIVQADEDVKAAICKAAKDLNASMLVVGSHGKQTESKLASHAVNNYALDNSEVPVLVVRTH